MRELVCETFRKYTANLAFLKFVLGRVCIFAKISKNAD